MYLSPTNFHDNMLANQFLKRKNHFFEMRPQRFPSRPLPVAVSRLFCRLASVTRPGLS
jgi:hypothetical protein